ncbi:polypeptide N-acetylgalactosaminyltransferase [Elysia marginata]|uniref:Polypeptide N-acetylgalactosaminyltransferase n=1 Tax=Elysia marginata TaxID=1093978 RepID=A0AAV4J8Q0_9GAST|nr:polypeptide N-acetylgalactosaminyltransferase [Elysia marginata]
MRLYIKRLAIGGSTTAVVILLLMWMKKLVFQESKSTLFKGSVHDAPAGFLKMREWEGEIEKIKFLLRSGVNQSNGGLYNADDFGVGSELRNLRNRDSKDKYNLNIWKSETIPLDREVPDSRPEECMLLKYPEDLPPASVVITMHNEWPSVVLRTVNSIINRTPSFLLKEIIIVDDASDIDVFKAGLGKYVASNFEPGLIKLIHLKSREGLIRSRLKGLHHVTAKVVVFLDSHMEVNKDWLQPLLKEIVNKKETLALAQLDYIDKDTFEYIFYPGYRTRYGFRWNMQFFETYFRPDQTLGKLPSDPLPGVLFVGTGFAVDVEYFKQIGSYDPGMMIWGGENIELAWRVWMCGGQILHIPCSHIGHIERNQPYTFPEGRLNTEMYNYKRAVDVWLGDYKKYVYQQYPGMETMDAGSLEDRKLLPHQLNCHNFTWFLDNIWPELLPYKEGGVLWGMIRTSTGNMCLDNDDYVFQSPNALVVKPCIYDLQRQAFSLSRSGALRTTIHCVIAKSVEADLVLFVENCFLNHPQRWTYKKNQLVHITSGMCLHAMGQREQTIPVLQPCKDDISAQKWLFESKGML